MVTGFAGFIGFHLPKALIQRGDDVLGVGNVKIRYDVSLKKLGLNEIVKLPKVTNLNFIEIDIPNRVDMESLLSNHKLNRVVNRAA